MCPVRSTARETVGNDHEPRDVPARPPIGGPEVLQPQRAGARVVNPIDAARAAG